MEPMNSLPLNSSGPRSGGISQLRLSVSASTCPGVSASTWGEVEETCRGRDGNQEKTSPCSTPFQSTDHVSPATGRKVRMMWGGGTPRPRAAPLHLPSLEGKWRSGGWAVNWCPKRWTLLSAPTPAGNERPLFCLSCSRTNISVSHDIWAETD